ncbi:hypothetical protein PtB15_1B514 [Puccinia triticina]|nr:hypothetical protein PtB15_1B514 [Puccinia triticina]
MDHPQVDNPRPDAAGNYPRPDANAAGNYPHPNANAAGNYPRPDANAPGNYPCPDASGNWPMPGGDGWDLLHDEHQPALAACAPLQSSTHHGAPGGLPLPMMASQGGIQGHPANDHTTGQTAGPGAASGASYQHSLAAGPPMNPTTPTHSYHGRQGASDPGGPGPIRHTPTNPSPSPYRYSRHEPLAQHERPSAPPASERPLSAATSWNSSRSENSLALVRPDTLTFIRDNIGTLRANIANTEEFIRVAAPVFNRPEHERWPAAMVMILAGLEDIQSGMVTKLVSELKSCTEEASRPATTTLLAPKSEVVGTLKNFVHTNLRIVLLDGSLNAYGRLRGRRINGAVTPFTAMKVLIGEQDSAFLSQFPANWQDNDVWNSQFDTLITNDLKAEKHKLVGLISSNLPTTGKPPPPVPDLFDLVEGVFLGMLPRYKDACPKKINAEVKAPAKAQLAHMRMVFNLNRIARDEGSKVTFWHQLDNDLYTRIGKPRLYHFAFAWLILKKDRALWNKTRTVNDVDPADFALPTKEEIKAECENQRARRQGQDPALPPPEDTLDLEDM